MRSNTEKNHTPKSAALVCIHIEYALLACLSYTSGQGQVTEMLMYVLVCSAMMADMLKAHNRILELIDHMAEIIGPDYSGLQPYPPAVIFAELDCPFRRILFQYMAGQDCDKQETDLNLAKNKFTELLARYTDDRFGPSIDTDEFLLELRGFLTSTLDRIAFNLLLKIHQPTIPRHN